MFAQKLFPRLFILVALLAAVALMACSEGGYSGGESMEVADDIAARRGQFKALNLGAELGHLSEGDRTALDHLIAAADHMDAIFKEQVWTGNAEFAQRVADYEGPDAADVRAFYRIHYGPWDRLTVDFEAALDAIPHPDGAGYYPTDMTKEEFEAWIAAHPDDEEAFMSLHTVIERDGENLVAVPYSEAYREHLEAAAAEIRKAADATDDPTLAKFLRSRADAFFSGDYYQSDFDWMDLAGDLEIVIGPYETYEDNLFGYKAAFESFVCVSIPEESAALEKYKSELPFLERNLPIPDEHKNLDRGSESPIRVTDLVYTGGDTRAGIQTIAFNLPNDERVREAKGSKKVLLKNIIRGKYDAVLTPIARRTLPEAEAGRINFDSYFNEVLFHELVHGIGPGTIMKNGEETEVRLELKELYSAFEEAKADVVGLHSLYALADKGLVEAHIVDHMPWTVVAGFFRSARFGTASAHGQGVVMEINYLIEKGAVEVTADGRFRPVPEQWRAGIEALSTEFLMIQALGDYDAAKAFLEKYGTVRAEMQAIFDDLDDVPVDIDPVYAYVNK